MLTFTDQYNERDVELGLIKHVEKFLIEMGAGFAFMGRQYHIEVSGDDYSIASRIISDTLSRQLIKPYNENQSRKYAQYIPWWA